MEFFLIVGLALAAFAAGVVLSQRVKDAAAGVPKEAQAELALVRADAVKEAALVVAKVKAKL